MRRLLRGSVSEEFRFSLTGYPRREKRDARRTA